MNNLRDQIQLKLHHHLGGSFDRYTDITDQIIALLREEIKARDEFVMGWRENDWPEQFDRNTAEAIALAYEDLFLPEPPKEREL